MRSVARRGIGGALVAIAVFAAGACSSDGGSVEAFCTRIKAVPTVTSTEQLQAGTATETLAELAVALKHVREVAPSEIRPDVKALYDVVKALRTAASTANSPTADAAALQQQLDVFAGASDRVVAYTRRSCGLDLGSTDR